MAPPGRWLWKLALLALTAACTSTQRQSANAGVGCDRTMAIIINQSGEAVEAVAYREGAERVLALAPPGLASQPFNPPRPEEQHYARPEQGQLSYWYLREVASRRVIPARDPKVRTDRVCVE
jgi:hypothetical protein